MSTRTGSTTAIGFCENTAIGCVGVAVTRKGLASLTIQRTRAKAEAELRRRYPAGARIDATATAAVRREITEYLAGTRRRFGVTIDWSAGTPFQRQVWQALRKVRFGQTVSYGDLAEAVGRPGAARAVGNAMNKNPIALVVPCHRVLRAGGALGGFGGGLDVKRRLLELEGVELGTAPGQHPLPF